MGSFLQVEIWQQLPLLDDHDFFSNAKLQENAPFRVRNYLNIFNEPEEIGQDNIKEMIYKLLDEFSYGKFNMESKVITSYS